MLHLNVTLINSLLKNLLDGSKSMYYIGNISDETIHSNV